MLDFLNSGFLKTSFMLSTDIRETFADLRWRNGTSNARIDSDFNYKKNTGSLNFLNVDKEANKQHSLEHTENCVTIAYWNYTSVRNCMPITIIKQYQPLNSKTNRHIPSLKKFLQYTTTMTLQLRIYLGKVQNHTWCVLPWPANCSWNHHCGACLCGDPASPVRSWYRHTGHVLLMASQDRMQSPWK
jgi:hypothetical protein